MRFKMRINRDSAKRACVIMYRRAVYCIFCIASHRSYFDKEIVHKEIRAI